MAIQNSYPALRPSLLLDFANSRQLDPRITFTRSTTATYYDGVTTAKAEENLLTYSQEFDNAVWSKTASTVTANSTTAPDGTSTADTLTETATTNYHSTYQTNISLAATSYTFSCFAKPNGRNEITLVMLSGSDIAYATYNVSTGSITVAATTSGSFSSASTTITASANGFYRVTLTATAPSTSTATLAIELYNAARTYAGNGTSGVYLWGAQLEQRSSVTAYTATTTQAITNYIPVLQTAAAGQARFDHNPTTGESLGLLIEEARTNVCLYSSDFSNAAWVFDGGTKGLNTAIAPDGTQTADQYVENTTSSANHEIYQSVSITSGNAYTFSGYFKSNGRNISIRAYATSSLYTVDVNLTNGSIISTGGTGSNTITSVGNGWYRITATVTATATGTGYWDARPLNASNTSTYTGDGYSGVFLWGAQLEAGSFATSYIPTVASSVTRNADAASMTGTNFSSWFNNSEGTLFANFKTSVATNYPQAAFISDGTSNNCINIDAQSGLRSIVTTLGATTAFFSASKSGSGDLVTLAYKVNDFGSSFNGAAAGTDTSGNVPVVSQFGIGQSYSNLNLLNGTIKKISYYPIKATSAQLQALTV